MPRCLRILSVLTLGASATWLSLMTPRQRGRAFVLSTTGDNV
jgi:hypothetical protein